MPFGFKKNRAMLQNPAGVDHAAAISVLPRNKPPTAVDLATCKRLHAASLQVSMAVWPAVFRWPEDTEIGAWFEAAFKNQA
jgi:hypothetical protein